MKPTHCVLPPVSHLLDVTESMETLPSTGHESAYPSSFSVAASHRPNHGSQWTPLSAQRDMGHLSLDHMPIKAKRKRASSSQLSVLNHVFSQTYFPSTELRIELGKQLGMSPRTVQIWFQNKRQSIRTRERTAGNSGRREEQTRHKSSSCSDMGHHRAFKHPLVSPPLSPPFPVHASPLMGASKTPSPTGRPVDSMYHLPSTQSGHISNAPHSNHAHVSLPSLRLPSLPAMTTGFPPTPSLSSSSSPSSAYPSPTSMDTIHFRE